jgi:hypothetical protein
MEARGRGRDMIHQILRCELIAKLGALWFDGILQTSALGEPWRRASPPLPPRSERRQTYSSPTLFDGPGRCACQNSSGARCFFTHRPRSVCFPGPIHCLPRNTCYCSADFINESKPLQSLCEASNRRLPLATLLRPRRPGTAGS